MLWKRVAILLQAASGFIMLGSSHDQRILWSTIARRHNHFSPFLPHGAIKTLQHAFEALRVTLYLGIAELALVVHLYRLT